MKREPFFSILLIVILGMASAVSAQDRAVIESVTYGQGFEEEARLVKLGRAVMTSEEESHWENSLISIQRTAQDLIQHNDQLRAQHDMLTKQVNRLKKAIALQDRENRRMRADIERRQQAIDNGEWEKNVDHKLEEKKIELGQLQRELKVLQAKIDSTNRALNLQKLKRDDLSLEKESWMIEVSKKEQQLSAAVLAEHPELVELQQQNEAAAKHIQRLEKELDMLNKTPIPTEEELAVIREQNKALVEEIETTRQKKIDEQRMNIMNLSQQEKERYQEKLNEKEELIQALDSLRKRIQRSGQANQSLSVDDPIGPTFLVREMSRLDAHNQRYAEQIEYMKENVYLLKERVAVLRQQYESIEANRARSPQ